MLTPCAHTGIIMKFHILHDQRALLGRYLRRADAERERARWNAADVVVTAQDEICDPRLRARLVHWIEIDKRGRSR